nr:Gag-Pol polyprotein [Tanacetum cinerariifolium]
MSMIGELKFFLGLQVHQSSRSIFVNQSMYALDTLKKHGIDKWDGIGTPMATSPKLDADLSCLDTRKITSRGIQFLGDKLVGWSSKKQDCTAMLTIEAKTEHQLADMFTKALSKGRSEYLVRRLDMRCLTLAKLKALANESAWYFNKHLSVLSTWMEFKGNTRDLGSFGEETNEIMDLHQILEEVLLTARKDGVVGITRRHRDPSSDGIRDLVTASGRSRKPAFVRIAVDTSRETRVRRKDTIGGLVIVFILPYLCVSLPEY